MRTRVFVIIGVAIGLVALTSAPPAAAQLPLAPVRGAGLTVTPAFEGWYVNPDGTFSISFGYYNRNSDETLEIPIGADNFIEPGDLNQGQPTTFHPARHWGVFAVTVPADFGNQRVVWTLKIRGETFSIPGSLKPDWQIDALKGEVSSGNTPPVLKFDAAGPEGRGPGGVAVGPLRTLTDEPLKLAVWVADDGRPSGTVRAMSDENMPVTLKWFKHQGPGAVTFDVPTTEVLGEPVAGEASTMATFSAPGEYVLRVRANDASGVGNAGHAQCCWTNGFVMVTVTEQ